MYLVVFAPYFTVTVNRSDGTFCPRYLPVLQVISVPNDRLKRKKSTNTDVYSPTGPQKNNKRISRTIPGSTYTSQGSPPTVTSTSSLVAVSRSFPPIVITVPPAAGPFSGVTVLGSGS